MGLAIFAIMRNLIFCFLPFLTTTAFAQNADFFHKKKNTSPIDITFKIGARNLTNFGDSYTMLELSRYKYGDGQLDVTSTSSFFSGTIQSFELGIQKGLKKGWSGRGYLGFLDVHQRIDAKIESGGTTIEEYQIDHLQTFVYSGVNIGYDVLNELTDLDLNLIVFTVLSARVNSRQELAGNVFLRSVPSWSRYSAEDLIPAPLYDYNKIYVDPNIGVKLEFTSLFVDVTWQTFNMNYARFGSRGDTKLLDRYNSINYSVGLSF